MYIHNYCTKTTKSCNLERPELLDKYYLKCCKTSQNELDFKLVKQFLLIDRFSDFPLKNQMVLTLPFSVYCPVIHQEIFM